MRTRLGHARRNLTHDRAEPLIALLYRRHKAAQDRIVGSGCGRHQLKEGKRR
jgi:hypothetical protein